MSFDYAGQLKPAHLQSETEFDAWLAEHDRQVKADAWDEGLLAGQDPYGFDTTNNPYR